MSGADALAIAAAGLLFALASALHCAGMCGVFAVRAASALSVGGGLSAYLIGKTFTYVFLGALAGAAGARVLAIAGPVQLLLGVLVGVLFVLAGWRLLAGRGARDPATGGLARAFTALLAPLLSDLRGAEAAGGVVARRFTLGALTGLLPCGITGLAVLQAAALGTPAGGALFMAAFGLGTAPALVGVALLGRGVLAGAGARRLRHAAGGLLVAAGLVALLRVGFAAHADSAGGGDSPVVPLACPLCPR